VLSIPRVESADTLLIPNASALVCLLQKVHLGGMHVCWQELLMLRAAPNPYLCIVLLSPCTVCYDCVDARIAIGGRNNYCPVCGGLLGPNPFESNKLKYDFILDALVRKVGHWLGVLEAVCFSACSQGNVRLGHSAMPGVCSQGMQLSGQVACFAHDAAVVPVL
jgi:hypothetical protein